MSAPDAGAPPMPVLAPGDPAGRGPATIEDVLARVPGKPNAALGALFVVLVLAGAAAFAFTVVADPRRGWGAVLVNLLFWLPMTQAGVLLAGVFLLLKAKWAVPTERVALGMGTFAPWLLGVLALTLAFGSPHLFPWVREPIAAKAAYLNLPFLYAREIGLVGILTLLGVAFRRRIHRLDAGLARGRVREDLRARYERWSAGWKGDAAELAAARRTLPRLAGVMIPLYAVVYTVVAWDLVMSLDPRWATTQIAPWFWVGGLLTAFAALSVLSLVLRRAYGLERFYGIERAHQLGKLVFGMTNFRTYLSWVLFLPIWYANLPEESSWMVLRVHFPFAPWLLAAVFFGWFVPLVGFMNLAAKKRPAAHIFFAASILLGVWIEQIVLVYPSLYRTTMPVGLPEIGVTLGFVGGFGLCFQRYAATRPLVALDKLGVLAEPFH